MMDDGHRTMYLSQVFATGTPQYVGLLVSTEQALLAVIIVGRKDHIMLVSSNESAAACHPSAPA
jgi:hypothetical protein